MHPQHCEELQTRVGTRCSSAVQRVPATSGAAQRMDTAAVLAFGEALMLYRRYSGDTDGTATVLRLLSTTSRLALQAQQL